MARQPRIDFPGAFHHVMNRGAAHQDIYKTDLDRELFLTLWEQAASRFKIEVITFALMSNHYHVLVRSPDAQLSETLQFVGRKYTQIFNSRHGRDGALFRGRFHSILVDSETYLARVARYVELNPVAAGLCSLEDLNTHRWSSFRYSTGQAKSPDWLVNDHLRRRFGTTTAYRDFVGTGVADTELQRFFKQPKRHGAVLGSDDFVARIAEEFPDSDVTTATVAPGLTPPRIEALIMNLTGSKPDDILETSRPMHPARCAGLLLTHQLSDWSNSELAHRYGFSSDETFLSAVYRARDSISEDLVALFRQSLLEQCV